MHNKQIFTDGLIFDDNYKVFAAKLFLQTMASSEPVFWTSTLGNVEWWISTSPRGWLLTLQETTRIREELGFGLAIKSGHFLRLRLKILLYYFFGDASKYVVNFYRRTLRKKSVY